MRAPVGDLPVWLRGAETGTLRARGSRPSGPGTEPGHVHVLGVSAGVRGHADVVEHGVVEHDGHPHETGGGDVMTAILVISLLNLLLQLVAVYQRHVTLEHHKRGEEQGVTDD